MVQVTAKQSWFQEQFYTAQTDVEDCKHLNILAQWTVVAGLHYLRGFIIFVSIENTLAVD